MIVRLRNDHLAEGRVSGAGKQLKATESGISPDWKLTNNIVENGTYFVVHFNHPLSLSYLRIISSTRTVIGLPSSLASL
jgi:hypothetical protein